MAKTDVWYQCADCKARGRGDDGRLFCGDCGGAVHRIGYRQHGAGAAATKPQPHVDAVKRGIADREALTRAVKRDPKRWMW